MDDDALHQLFADYDAISANVQLGFDKRSRGYGIVKFSTTEEASNAIGDFNGYEHDGRQLSVRFDAKPQGRCARGPRVGGESGGFSKRGAPNSSIFVRNLPENYRWTDLEELFGGLSLEFDDVKTGAGWCFTWMGYCTILGRSSMVTKFLAVLVGSKYGRTQNDHVRPGSNDLAAMMRSITRDIVYKFVV